MPEDNKKTLEEKMDSFLETYEENLIKQKEDNESMTDSKITALKAEMKAEMEEYVKAVRATNVSVPGSDEETYKGEPFSFAKACHAIVTGEWSNAELEQKIFQEARKKAQDTNTGAQGAYLIPTELAMDKILKPALAQTVLQELGITMWPNLTDDVDIPEAEDRPTLTWAADGANATEKEIAFGLKQLRPKTGNMLLKMSNKLLKQQSAAEPIVRMLMQEGISLGVDQIGLTGTGSASQPLGILNATGLNTATAIGANGGRLTVDKVASMIADVQDDNYLKIQDQGGLLCHPRVKSGLKRERVAQFSGDTLGMPLINPLMTDKVLEETLGLKVRSTTNVPKNIAKGSSTTLSKAVVGEWKQFAMGLWGGMAIKSSDVAGTAFQSNQTWLVVFLDIDTLVLHPEAFSIISDAATTESEW